MPKNLSVEERMERLLRTVKGRKPYGKRKEAVEPVFGRIKEQEGFDDTFFGAWSMRRLNGSSSDWGHFSPPAKARLHPRSLCTSGASS